MDRTPLRGHSFTKNIKFYRRKDGCKENKRKTKAQDAGLDDGACLQKVER